MKLIHLPHIKGYETYRANVIIDGKPYVAKILVDLVKDKARGRGYYYHQVEDITLDESVGTPRELLNAEHKASSPDSSNADKTIAQDDDIRYSILGLSKMSESCPGVTYSKLSWLQDWHIRDETYSAALAALTNAQLKQPFASHWGDGTTSSSDGQPFQTANGAKGKGQVNPKNGSDPNRQLYTHVTDQYSPFSSKIINVGVRDATYVLDGLLYHESDLRIEEHYTDTSGFTDQVFGMMHLLGFKLAPRIRNLSEIKLFAPPKQNKNYTALQTMISSEEINVNRIKNNWDEIQRLTVSIQQGSATASLLLRKLSNYPRQNGLALALREIGRIERTLFILDWLENVDDLRQRVTDGLNKGESRNALARAVFFNRLGEIRDRSYQQQAYRAGGLELVTSAIVLWNTVYMEKAVQFMSERGDKFESNWCKHLSPLGWEHIGLTGDYLWKLNNKEKSLVSDS